METYYVVSKHENIEDAGRRSPWLKDLDSVRFWMGPGYRVYVITIEEVDGSAQS